MHVDVELLSLLALGEDAGTEQDRTHAQTCAACAHELSELHDVVALGREVRDGSALTTPRQEVWARIRGELALDAPAGRSTRPPVEAPEPLPTAPFSGGPSTADRRGRRSLIAGSSHPFEDEPTAHLRLAPVDASWSEASGEAELATDEHGRRLLQVALRADLPASGVRQAWLVHRDDPELRQSLGILDGRHGLWTVAHSIDLEQYAILDISQQATGETAYSGQTIVRGEFTLVG